MKGNGTWNIQVSQFATKTINPIRQVLENLNASPNPEKEFISLSIGDPTIFGNIEPHPAIMEAMIESLKSNKYNGYLPSNGCESARKAIAEYSSINGLQIDPRDVIITSGCSHALEMCIGAIGQPGTNILLPRPGFPLYQTLCNSFDINIKYYNLRPDQKWQIDLKNLESLIDENTVAIVYNNPSNPCGSVYSKEHIMEFMKVAERYRLPVIADEIYENLVFKGHQFIPCAALKPEVPVLSCAGTTKKFMAPGYRCGWIIINDKFGRFDEKFRRGLNNLTHRIVGCNSIVQGALPKILKDTPKKFFDENIDFIQKNAEICYSMLNRIPALRPIMPEGAMYIMVSVDLSHFPDIDSDIAFVEMLMSEESVFVLPGKIFNFDNFVRIVLTAPTELLLDACQRLEKFCSRHSISNGNCELPSDRNSLKTNLRKTVAVD
ncbi:tyrosine aminotransferase [Brevipalpus obovatus]|uniref:tyrosine aminotransferase n=1 Tax=Brevipalpus obovatus TaxID=246614 RepID=UPI003D9DFCA2